MRVRKKTWAAEELATNQYVAEDPISLKGHWKQHFKNDNPLYVEIGCGKGSFLAKNAIAFPDINYIGVERQPTVVAIAARRLKEMESGRNTALISGTVERLAEYFEVGEISRLYINFCDPWPKKKWYKRRLTYRGFLENYKELFGEKGEIFFKTDNRLLFEFSLNEFCADDWKLSNISLDLHHSDYEENIMTEYEEKFSSQGMPIYRLEARWEKKKEMQ